MYTKFRKLLPLIAAVATGLAVNTASADWNENAGGISASDPQDIVISLQANPMSDPERACLAVTFARSLSGNPLSNVTLFVTLDGVSLADASVVGNPRFKCEIPEDFTEDETVISLEDNLVAFLGDPRNDNNLVVCPICWNKRYGDELPDYGVLPGAEGVSDKAIGKMMFNADKIIDF